MSTVANVALTPTSKNKGRVGSARERERERKMKRSDDILDRGICPPPAAVLEPLFR